MLYIPGEINITLTMWEIRDEFDASLERARYRYDYDRIRVMHKVEDEFYERMHQLVIQHEHQHPTGDVG